MPPSSIFNSLIPLALDRVNRIIREHRYVNLSKIQEQLAKDGLDVKRSTLHRYVVALKKRDALLARPEEDTIVTIVERSSGEVRVVKTAITAEAVAALIASKA
ncbi:hypothetical protein [Comamonas koreensis]|uniref:Uncharacterized protein n=1 Tax=Comamonas koreensis TaxID=160825 RepID=A0AAW4XUQ6_9BURK|nr:hypothetical protein [Comamonas koreensis]MCD2164689.1 hypothetical protein [Comamonas koreensis]